MAQRAYPDPDTASDDDPGAVDDSSADGVDDVDPGKQRMRELQEKIQSYGATVPGARGGGRTSATGVHSFVPEV